ncbi:hypothetical protein GGI07_000080 [Coemansia sp. Benny D115]|nr:hypothetical protein GGI07_000080 [Coemansia sp. Benny D115]
MLKSFISLVFAAAAVMANPEGLSLYARDKASTSDVVMADASLNGNGISATFQFLPSEDKTGLQLIVKAKGLKEGVLYPYHVHTNVVPSNGNCTATGGHLDPFGVKTKAGANYKCDVTKAQSTCELGDLAGMFGNMTADASGNYEKRISDSILDFTGSNSILGHSIVIHGPDNARLACANITGYVLDKTASDHEEYSSHTSGASAAGIAAAAVAFAAAIAI